MKTLKTLTLSKVLIYACLASSSAQLQSDTLILFFDVNKSIVNEQNARLLDKITINQNILSVNIYGYTDYLGHEAYNQHLSEIRSRNVRNYLISKGISNEIIVGKGKGVHPNSIAESRQDLSDKGIKEHRIAKVVYKYESDDISNKRFVLTEDDLVVNNLIVLDNITFWSGTIRFRQESYPALEELLKIMKNNSTLKIEIHGHICCVNETTEYYESYSRDPSRYDPSRLRAQAVYDFLVEGGIDPARMRYRGFGATRKKYPLERDFDEMAKNRRVEIFILEI